MGFFSGHEHAMHGLAMLAGLGDASMPVEPPKTKIGKAARRVVAGFILGRSGAEGEYHSTGTILSVSGRVFAERKGFLSPIVVVHANPAQVHDPLVRQAANALLAMAKAGISLRPYSPRDETVVISGRKGRGSMIFDPNGGKFELKITKRMQEAARFELEATQIAAESGRTVKQVKGAMKACTRAQATARTASNKADTAARKVSQLSARRQATVSKFLSAPKTTKKGEASFKKKLRAIDTQIKRAEKAIDNAGKAEAKVRSACGRP